MARKSDEELLCMIKSTAEGSSITTVTSYAVEVGFSEDSHSEKKENFNTDIADLNVKLKSTFEVNPSTDEQSCTNYEQGVSGDTRKESVSLEETVGKKLKAEQKIKMAGCEDKCDSHKNLQVHTSTSGEREKTHTLQQNTAITMERDNKMEYHIEKTVIGDVNESDIESSECESDGSSDFHLLSKSELVHSLQECRTELSITKKKLEATLRLLKKSDDYNEVMRKMVEQLSSNIHNSKHRHMVSEGVQVDTEHLLNLSSVILPKWSDDNLKAASKATDHTMAVDQQAESNACTLSIAESIKQAAESVIQQQEQDEQEAMLKRTGYVFDPTSSQYYHPETGYYYDPKTTLFYDPSSGCYYYFNYEKGEYVFHAQVETQSSSSFQQHSFASENAPQVYYHGNHDRLTGYEEVLTGFADLNITPYKQYSRPHPAIELASSWPPCIRMIVTTSDSLSVGTLFIVPCTGSVIGREKCDVIIPDLNVSKEHATISYNEQSRQYEIVDNASQNGTIVNGTRISMPKVMSDPVVLSHGSNIWIAGTQLLCHIHSGTVTCDNCEPGIVMSRHQSSQNQELKVLTKEAKKLRQRQEMNEIKKKYGLKNSKYVDDRKVFNKPEYEDKAALRRKHVASDTSDYKSSAPSSVHRPISNDNIGHKLLAKMGWKEGESLGKDNSGIQEPINVTLRANQNAGLGSFGAGGFSMDDVASTDLTKASRRVQAQQRFNKIDSNGDGKGGKQGALMTWTKGDTQFSND
ncbi:angiogenic factor with G patch and FHA domains 1-like isoform X4 [Dreissena polymorpha]|uniref:angiogenic factor with G patch and FHA domains 1-like isoform X4 n=1 Tax=Dreissena polymorpha TaxID=45954 RepID=UPI002264BED4|nr:angiogenic factor with G patch and FHA domains 1-like isoform X4 [Dreissena polymorpha]